MDLSDPPLYALQMLDRPALVHPDAVKGITTFRQAVRLCWSLLRVPHMTQRHLAELAELRPQCVTDYLNPDDRLSRHTLPAEKVKAFEDVCGNTAITQWLASRHGLTVVAEKESA